MLILTRRVGESLVIGDEISVKVLGVKGGQVRLGVDAPRDIAIHRQEVAERTTMSELETEDASARDAMMTANAHQVASDED